MKSSIFCLILFILVMSKWTSAANRSSLRPNQPEVTLKKVNLIREYLGRKLGIVWKWMGTQNEDTFVGRCLGMARKLKFIMPLMVFSMGVIITKLAFLTIFSMKSLSLLVLLLIMNASGFAAKLALLFKGSESHHQQQQQHKAQNVHFHIHQSKNGQFSVEPSGYGHEYYERSDESSTSAGEKELSFYDRLNGLDMQYDPYRKKR